MRHVPKIRVLATVMLATVLAHSEARELVSSAARTQAPAPRAIRVSAERFAFTPTRIEIEAGEAVEFHVKSDDTSHGFRILGPGGERVLANVAIPKRGKGDVVVPLRIDEPGRYVFECSRMCGAGHNFMRGELVVRERAAAANGR